MISNSDFRQALGQFATGIAVATTLDAEGKPHGLTINSFNSVSLDPPLVLWSLEKKSHQYEAFKESGKYGISVLAESQKDLSIQFASPVADRFEGVKWDKGSTGSPLLEGAVAHIECEVAEFFDGGDHVILLGRVVGLSTDPQAPLLYFGGQYHQIGDTLAE